MQDVPIHCPAPEEATDMEKLLCDKAKAPKPDASEMQPLSGGGGGDQPPKKPPVPVGD